MDLTDDTQRGEWRTHLAGLLRDRSTICALAPLAGHVETVALLEEAGARRPLLVASAVGAGPTPRPEQAEVVLLELPDTTTMTEDVRRQDRVLRALPAELLRAVEAYDPEGTAAWLVGPFIRTSPLLGREVLTGRPDSWFALEDKLVVDALWDEAGVPRAESRAVPLDRDRLRAASGELDAGSGVVWAGDAREGFNGAGDFVRWVVTEDDARAAQTFFAEHCDRVRVMPFLDGVPCSIHGFVLPDDTAVLRPVELATLRAPGRRFLFGGLGTTWDPPAEDRAAMRDLTRRTGELLRDMVGYRGAFGIDGVLSADGFRPTELNSRLSAGASSLAGAVDATSLHLLQYNLLAGRDPAVGAPALEAWLLPALDAARFAKATAMAGHGMVTEPQDVDVAWNGEALSRSDAPTGWSVALGPNPAGTYCRLVTPAGPGPGLRVADLNVALVAFLDAELGTGFGDVTSAPDVRRTAR